MPDHLDDEQVAEIQKYAAAFRAEFEENQDRAPAKKYSKDDVDGQLDGIIPDAIAAIAYTLKHGTNESLKAKIAQWLIDKKLEVERDGKDPLYKFLTGLTEESSPTGHVVKPTDNAA